MQEWFQGKEDISGRRQEKQEGKLGQWQQESPVKYVPEQAKRSADTDCGLQTTCLHRNEAWQLGETKEECRKEGNRCEWTFERIHEKVAMVDVGRLGIAQEIPRKNTDCLRRMIAPIDGTRRRQQQKEEALQLVGAACGGQYDWRAPNRILLVQFGVNANEAKARRAHAAPLGLCDNLNNAPKLLANQQKDGDSPIQSIVTGLHERSRRGIMDGDSSGQSLCGGRG